MPNRLHVTNGDLARARIEPLVAPEPVLAWQDTLYEGPVPMGLGLEELSALRARYLAERHRLDPERTLQAFRERDRRWNEAMARGDELTLWFEHDLTDQLQLVQILGLLGGAGVPAERVRLAQADTYLTDLADEALRELGASAPTLDEAQLALGRAAWAAFTAATPEDLARLYESDTSALPWLGPALERLLEELPTDYPGLSTTERYILEELEPGPSPARELWRRCQAREQARFSARFMGDRSFFAVLDELAAEPSPFVSGLPPGGFPGEEDESAREAYLAAQVRLTHAGLLAREGRLDRSTEKPLDRWLGGTHLTPDNPWRWEPATAALHQV